MLGPVALADPAAPALFWVEVAQAQLSALQGELDKLGPAHIEGRALYFGGTKISGNNGEASEIGRRVGAIWIYQRESDRFSAVATDMHGQGGGYDLDRPIAAQAAAALRAGKPYFGMIPLAPNLSARKPAMQR